MESPLNGPLETGLRVLVVLNEFFPDGLDLGRLVLLDHCILHSADFDGPPSLHPDLPLRSGELGVKRAGIELGLQVMVRAGLARVDASVVGITFHADDEAGAFIGLLQSRYVRALVERARWVSMKFGPLDEDRFRAEMNRSVGGWEHEFDFPSASRQA